MEYDCEMFDDSEAALDALLASARWDMASVEMTDRLKALLSAEAEESPTVTWASGPCEEFSATEAPLVSEREQHAPEARVTNEGLAAAPIRSQRRIRHFLAIAASIIIVIGIALLITHAMTKPRLTSTAQKSMNLPGRAPTPMELWAISPAGQKYFSKLPRPAPPPIDPHEARITRLCQSADSQALASAMLRETEPESRQKLLEALLQRRDGMDRFLDLIRNRPTRDVALAMLDNLPEPPTNALLAELNSLSVERRFAAAKALGSFCHGQTLPTLKRMIETGNHQREALAVLSECSDSAATAYVRQLQRRPALAIQLNAVRGEMEKLF